MRKPGFHHIEETKRKIGYANSHPTEETRLRKRLGQLGKPKSKEAVDKMKRTKKGSKYALTEEQREKIRQRMLTNNPMKNTKSLAKVKASKLINPTRMFGEKNPAWNGGSSFELYPKEFFLLRGSIRERDSYICQICGIKENSRQHCIHHIDYNKWNCTKENLILLCHICNKKVNTNRQYWEIFLQEKIINVTFSCVGLW